MSSIASLVVKIGGDSKELERALATVGEKARGLDTDLKKLGNTPIAAQAQKSLDSMRATMTEIAKAQQGVADRAAAAAEGIAQIGGASKLTDSQLKQVNRTLQEGLSAFKALGQEAPEQLKSVANAVSGLNQPLDFFDKKIIAIGAAIGTFLGNAALQAAHALVEAGKETFRYADQLENLSAATGIGVGALQDLEAIGVTSGTSIQTLANSVEQLQKHLDDPAAMKALAQMGLDYATIRNLAPEDQFLQIAKAVAAIEDPVARANAGTALFGRTWFTIAPAIKGNIDELVGSMKKLTDAQLEAIDKSGDRFDLFIADNKRRLAGLIGDLILAADEAQLHWRDILNPAATIIRLESGGNRAAIAAQIKDLEGLPKIQGGAPILPGLPAGFQPAAEQTDAIRDLESQIAKTQAAAEKFKAVQDQLFGRATIEHANELVKALGGTENLTKLTDTATKHLHDELGQALAAYHALGRDVPPLLQAIFDKTNALQTITGRTIGTGLGFAPAQINLTGGRQAASPLGTGPTSITSAARENIAAVSGIGKTLASDLFASVPAAIQAAIQGGGSKLQAAGSAIGMTLFGQDSTATKVISGGISKLFGADGFLSKTLAGTVPIIGSLIGPAIEGLGKLFGKVFGTAGRDAVREFAGSQGGFDELHTRLATLGTDGEQMWKSLTQGVGRNNPEEAKAAIERVTAAFEAQRKKLLDLKDGLSTIGQRLSTITTLSPELKTALDKAMNVKSAKDLELALRDINNALDSQVKKFNDIRDTLAKYKLPETEAGKPFQQEASNQQAVTLRHDFDVLRGSGVDVNHVMEAMKGNLQAFVDQARIAGVEVPESMREVIQVALDAGIIYDSNGKQIKNMADLGLNFGSTMKTVLEKTIPGALDKLTRVLEGLAKFLGITLPGAAEDGAADVQDALDDITPPDLTVHVKTVYDPSDTPDSGGLRPPSGGVPEFAEGSHGFRDFGRGTLAILHGREAVVTADQVASMNAAQQNNIAGVGALGGMSVELHFHGAVLAEREYIEQNVAQPVLDAINRYHLPAFGRMVQKVGN